MEFFIPGLLLFLVSILVIFFIVPRFTPLIIAILSIVFLVYGVYDHYKMFESEYRLSTWQQTLKLYAPAVMIVAIILFIIYGILAFFTKGSVPVPTIPSIAEPNDNSTTDQVIQTLNNISNTITNNKNTGIMDKANDAINNALGNNTRRNNNNNNNTNRNRNKPSRSFVETF